MSRMLSGSALAIAAECAWAYHKDSVYTEVRGEDGERGDNGSSVHGAIAARLTPGAVASRLRPELAAKVHQGLQWLESQGIALVGVERSYAYKPSDRSVRVLGDNLDRKYEEHGLDPATEIPLTVDLIGRRRDGTYVVVDWKNDALRGHLEPAGESLQLGLAAYCVAKVHMARTVDVAYVFVGVNDAHWDDSTHSGLTLQRVLGRTEQAWSNSKRKLPLVDGEHCRYCPALGGCPKTRESFEGMDDAAPETKGVVWTTGFVSVENDAKIALSITAMEKALEKIREALKERARQAPIPLPDGKVWGPGVSPRATFDKRKAEELLGDRFGECVGSIEVESFRARKPK